MGVHSDSALQQAYKLIEQGEPAQAKVLLEDALTTDFDNTDIIFTARCCSYWVETFETLYERNPYEQGEALLSRWKQFTGLLEREDSPKAQTVETFKRAVYSFALKAYQNADDGRDFKMHAELCKKIALCYKRLGSYETAKTYIEEANALVQGQAAILAEMADCYDLCGDAKIAKLLFKEAFFIAAQKIDLSNLDSPLINSLISKVKDIGYSGSLLQEWIPVYGILLGLFNVKRQLRAQEVGRLKQDIYAKENELKNPANNAELLTPRLINMYLWLIDYYLITKESMKKIQEVTLKLKILDPVLFKEYFE